MTACKALLVLMCVFYCVHVYVYLHPWNTRWSDKQ